MLDFRPWLEMTLEHLSENVFINKIFFWNNHISLMIFVFKPHTHISIQCVWLDGNTHTSVICDDLIDWNIHTIGACDDLLDGNTLVIFC